ncbi:DUF5677 domain-containing protein [Brevibacillus choshinensis]|uniref:DUF5677 domain-containing protein n=1 Tax=Brevibacillus choshinensis TaxID=54911 RepID=UPI002E21C07F|nr:hypothetical protein [Brevibacillus choshinensis]
MPVEAQIILRSMIQVLIHLRLLQKDERYIDTLIVSERAEQLKLLNVYTEPANNDIFTPSNVHFETKKQLKKELNGFRKDKIERLADEEYMDIQGGELMSFHLGYDFHEYPRIFYTSNNLLLSAADFIHDIFKDTFDEKRSLEFTEKLKYYHDKFVKLSGIDPDLAPND